MRVVCISEEVFKKLKELLGGLSPLLVVDADIVGVTRPVPSAITLFRIKVPEAVLSVVEPGKTYRRREILRLVEKKYNVKLPEGTLSSALSRLIKKSKLKRVKHGVYQLTE